MGKHTLFTTAPLLSLLLIACGAYGDEPGPGPLVNGPSTPVTDGPKAPPVQGAPQSSDLVETLGVFVTEKGNDAGDGSRTRPFATIQHGIEAAKKVGKRVYVCAGSYSESLTIADSISVIGGLDCSQPEWKPGSADARSKVVAPTSPAITARNVLTPTRLSGLDVTAPNATEPGGSSIGLFALSSPAIVVASSSIVAGGGAKGSDGADGVQLTQSAQHDGQPSLGWAECNLTTCKRSGAGYVNTAGTGGSISLCGDNPAQNGEKGGDGGSGGLWVAQNNIWVAYYSNVPEAGGPGTAAIGVAGMNGSPAAPVGALGSTGYVPADGRPGSDGQPGKGGAGGTGSAPALSASAAAPSTVYRGDSGAGGGAGGCPGLAGEAGKGGGASIAIALIESAIALEDVLAISGSGGSAGVGSFGSRPSRGGSPSGGQHPANTSVHGGNGGVAGTSSNGSAGPSFGIAHVGAAPTLKGATKIEQGKGGAGVEARTKTQGVGGDVSIAATPDGLSEAIHAF